MQPSSACRCASATRSSATCTSPRKRAAPSSTMRTRLCWSRSPRPREWRSRTPVSMTRPAAAALATGQRRHHPAAAVRGRAEEVLALVTEQALEISGADLVVLALPAGDSKQLVIEHAAGEGAEEALGLVLPADGRCRGWCWTGASRSAWPTSAPTSAPPRWPGNTCASNRRWWFAGRSRQGLGDPHRGPPPRFAAAGPTGSRGAHHLRRPGRHRPRARRPPQGCGAFRGVRGPGPDRP